MNQSLTIIGSTLAFAVCSTFAASTAHAAGELSFDTGNVICYGQNTIEVDIVNGTTQIIPRGTAILGTFSANYAAIPVGARVTVNLASNSNWRCDNAAMSLKLKTGSGLFTIPGERNTTMTRIQVGNIDGNVTHVHGDPSTQYVSCEDGMGSYWVEHWAVFSPGTEYYSFEGAIFSPWYSINIGSSHHDTPLQFFFDQNECPHVGDQFELIVDVGSTYLDAGGSIDPYWEEVTGSLTL